MITGELLAHGVLEEVIEIRKGWLALVTGLIREMARVNPNFSGLDITQIKQKFACLRVYADRAWTPEEDVLLTLAEYEAATTCEMCGEIGSKVTFHGGFVAIACVDCAKKEEKSRMYF